MPTRSSLTESISTIHYSATALMVFSIILGSCSPMPSVAFLPTPTALITPTRIQTTPIPTRPAYQPGELVDYVAQTGDTLPALASHFNSTVKEILSSNPIIPKDATTMPAGFPMKIPIYYQPLWGSPYQIIPDSQFIDGPATRDFNTSKFVSQYPGWLNGYMEYAADENRTGADIVDYVATNFSISPRLLLALLEYQSGALSNPIKPETDFVLGYSDYAHKGVYLQLVYAANVLNNGYYGWRKGSLNEIYLQDGRLERPDPWQNAATVGLRYYFSKLYPPDEYQIATEASGLAQTWKSLFGDPWPDTQPHIPGSLNQPKFLLPFPNGHTWAFTGGPHTGWGDGEPFAAVDFAPGAMTSGCTEASDYATAVANGIIARVGDGLAVLDLDGDGDERTGWVVFYLHVAAEGRVPLYSRLKAGDPIGHPSCEGGIATGTHVHIARKYNGEWILAGGPLALDLEGWIAQNGPQAYQGTLNRFSATVIACTCADQASLVTAGK